MAFGIASIRRIGDTNTDAWLLRQSYKAFDKAGQELSVVNRSLSSLMAEERLKGRLYVKTRAYRSGMSL
jgi:hypothetical protein